MGNLFLTKNKIMEKSDPNLSTIQDLKSQISALKEANVKLEEELQKHKSDFFHGGEIQRLPMDGPVNYVYYGHVKDGQPHGSGIEKYDDGRFVVTSYNNGKPHGKYYGIFDGDKFFHSNFVEGKQHGEAVITHKDGKVEKD